ncbi:MAG: glycosyltransferase family 4 protein [Spirosomataceae bacterium]
MKKRILFVGHDANRAGAQLFLWQVIRHLAPMYDCTLLLLGSGELLDDYRRVSTVLLWEEADRSKPKWNLGKKTAQTRLQGQSFDLIYLNTIAVARAFPWLKSHVNGPVVCHIHELEFSINFYSDPSDREFLWKNVDRWIGCSDAVSRFIRPQIPQNILVDTVHSFVDNDLIKSRAKKGSPDVSKSSLGLSPNQFLIGGCGQADWRKGMDLFLQTIYHCRDHEIHFVWIGFPSQGLFAHQIQYDLKRLGIEHRITLLPVTPLSVEWLAQLDLFLLSSREDPFPLVMLEAALAKVPILGFQGSGGCEEFVQYNTGWTVPYGDSFALAQKILEIRSNQSERNEKGQNAQKVVDDYFQFNRSIEKLESILTQTMIS